RFAVGVHASRQIACAAAEPATFGRNRDAEQSELRESLPHVAAIAVLRCNDAPACLEGVVARDEALDRRVEQALLFGGVEVHLIQDSNSRSLASLRDDKERNDNSRSLASLRDDNATIVVP